MLKKLISHSFFYAFGPQIPKVASIFILPITTAYLTPLDYGIYGTIAAYIGLFSGIQGLGVSVLLVNSYYRYKANGRWKILWKQYYGLLLVWSCIYAFILAVLLFFLMPEEAKNNSQLIIGILVVQAILFNATNNLGGRLFQVEEKPQFIALSSSVSGIVTILLNLLTIVYFRLGYLGWYISSFGGAMVLFLFYIVPIFRRYKLFPIFKYRKYFLRRNLKVSLPTVPHNYSVYLLNSSDRMVMDRLNVNIGGIGNYNLAYTFGNYFEVVGTAIGMAVGPFYAKLWKTKSMEDSKWLTYFLQVGFIIVTFLVSLWIKEILQILISNEELHDAYVFAVIIIMGYAYRPMYWSVVNKLFYTEQTTQLWKISFIAGVLNVVLNLIFIPIYGIIAAPITTFISLMYIGFSGYFLKAYKRLNDVNHFPAIWFVLIVISTVLVYYLKDISVFQKSIITFIALSIGIILFLIFKKRINQINI